MGFSSEPDPPLRKPILPPLCSGIGVWGRGGEGWGNREEGGDSFCGFPGRRACIRGVSVRLFISVSGGGS